MYYGSSCLYVYFWLIKSFTDPAYTNSILVRGLLTHIFNYRHMYLFSFIFAPRDDLNGKVKWLAIIMDEVHRLKDRKAQITIAAKALSVKRR